MTGSQAAQSGAPRTGGWTRTRIVFLSVSAALLAALVFFTRAVLLPFVVALIIAFVFTPLVASCERFRVPRALAILLIYAVFFGGLYFAVAAATPRLYVETRNFIREVPVLAHDLAERYGPRVERWIETFRRPSARNAQPTRPRKTPALVVTPRPDGSFAVEVGAGVDIVQVGARRWSVQPLPAQAPEDFQVTHVLANGVQQLFTYLGRNASELVRLGQAVVVSVSGFIFLLFMTLMLAGYIMLTRERIIGFFRSLGPPSSRVSFDRLLWRIDRGLSGVVRGQLIICLVNGVLSALGFWLFDLKYWPIMALIAGVMSLIPIFGAILSSIPAVAIGLTQGFWTGLWILLWILGIHQIEANLLNPKIIGTAARIHPVLVVFSLVVGEHFFGLWGALLAVPTWSLLQSFFNHFRCLALPDHRDSVPPGIL
ncbi:MAG: AI-2E family transporter [Polyangiaceae bacterium]|nr:AI-2E family transporter [Polyangiaceae bacterium]